MKRAAIAAVVLALAGCGASDDAEQLLPPGRTLAATAEITPRTSLFGDTLTARVVAAVDRRRVDPDELDLRARFAPYETVGPVEIERRDVGRQTQLVYTVRIRCNEFACLPREARTRFAFPPARLGSLLVRWPPLEVATRVNQSELQAFRYRATLTPLPKPSSRVSPRTLAVASLSAAVLLAALAFVLVGRAALRAWRRHPELDLPPVERALLLLRWTRNREDGEDRRRALELLAEALEGEGRRDLARAARKLAWSGASPSAQEAEALAEEVRRAA